jgi:hypothetical protein
MPVSKLCAVQQKECDLRHVGRPWAIETHDYGQEDVGKNDFRADQQT